MRKILPLPFFFLLLIRINSPLFSQNVVTVTDCNLNGWLKQPVGNSSVGFINGPSTPPLGNGSVKFYVPPGTNPDWPGDFVRLRNGQYSGVPLSSLTELSYQTYIEARDTIVDIPFIVILIDINGDGTAEHNLVFDPRYQNSTFIRSTMPDQGLTKEHVWQKWDCLHAGWFFGGTTDTDPDHNGPFFTLAEYLSLYPNATIRNDAAKGGPAIRLTAGGVVFKANFYGEIDDFKIGINGATTTYDFENSIANAGADKNVVYGYGSNCTTLNGAASGGFAPYTFEWSGGTTPNSSSTEVCPTASTTYTLTVTDTKGCIGSDAVTVNVNDVRCGNDMDKVKLCHNGQELFVAKDAVPAHLKHGDRLGNCNQQLSPSITGRSVHKTEAGLSQFSLVNYPNPFTASTQIAYEIPEDGNVLLKLFDLSGREITTLVNANQKQGKYLVSFSPYRLNTGIYYYKITINSSGRIISQTNKMVIVH